MLTLDETKRKKLDTFALKIEAIFTLPELSKNRQKMPQKNHYFSNDFLII